MLNYNLIGKVIKKYLRAFWVTISDPIGYISTRRFLRQMNYESHKYGLIKSFFVNPSGASSYSFSTAYDLCMLGKQALRYKEIINIWTCREKQIQISGINPRELTITNTVLDLGSPIMGDYLIGGKSGSWGTTNKSHIFFCNSENRELIVSIMAKDKSSFENIYAICLELLTNSDDLFPEQFTSEMLKNGGGYAIADVNSGDIISAKNEHAKLIPASSTKVLTAICALNSGLDLSLPVTISPIDISKGSGSNFIPGDIVTLSDALYTMMMESSNTMANAIARVVGSSF